MIATLASLGLPFIPASGDLAPVAPELILIGTVIAVLIAPFFRHRSNSLCALISLAGLLAAFLASISTATHTAAGPLFRGLLVTDSLAIYWKSILTLFSLGVVLMWFGVSRTGMHEGDGPEYFTLLLSATTGMCLMGSTSNLLMLFLAVELASLPSYVLAGFRKTRRLAAEAALKYVLFGAASSAIMVYGLSLFYGLYGTLQIETIAQQMAAPGGLPALAAVGLIGILVGLGFKISLVPLHFWCPDVFQGAHVDVSAFLSVASKGAAIVLLMRALHLLAGAIGYAPVQPLTAIAWTLGILGAITATWGNTAAFTQTNIKRLLAYSSIAHAGYMACGLSLVIKGASSAADFAVGPSAAAAILLYLTVYLFMNLGAFTVAGAVQRATGDDSITGFKGLGRRSPLLAFCMVAFLFSLVGLPPMAGFLAKLVVMIRLFENGGWWIALVVVIGVNTIFSLYYYMRIARAMYLEKSDAKPFLPGFSEGLISIACAVILVWMLIGFNTVDRLSSTHSAIFQAAAPAAHPVAPVVADMVPTPK